jgi:hypothetical protein
MLLPIFIFQRTFVKKRNKKRFTTLGFIEGLYYRVTNKDRIKEVP